jgi:splicing factor U2AF subunit
MTAWISNDGRYAFIEFRSVEEALAGYALNNMTLYGQPLRVGKPKAYASNQPATFSGLQALSATAIGLSKVSEEMASKLLGGKGRLVISGLPHGFHLEEVREVLERFGKLKCIDMPKDPLTGLTKGYAVFDFADDDAMAMALQEPDLTVGGCCARIARAGKESLAQALLPPTPDFDNRAKFTSRILVLKNLARITDLENEEDYDDLHEDVLEQCKKHGRVVSIVIPKPGEHTSGIGKIFVEFACLEEAQQAKTALTGMRFNGREVQCGYHPEELFFQSNFVCD